MIVVPVNGGDVWIGMSSLNTPNYYEWSDGSTVTITNWWRNEPNSKVRKRMVDTKQFFRIIPLYDTVSIFATLKTLVLSPNQEAHVDLKPHLACSFYYDK